MPSRPVGADVPARHTRAVAEAVNAGRGGRSDSQSHEASSEAVYRVSMSAAGAEQVEQGHAHPGSSNAFFMVALCRTSDF